LTSFCGYKFKFYRITYSPPPPLGALSESERVPACVRLCLSRLPCVPVVPIISTCVHVSQRISLSSTCLGKALDIPFYRYKEMPSCTMGCSYVLAWLAGKRLEPCRSIASGAAWMLLTFPCFRRRLRAIRRHGRTRGTIITCYRSNLGWDTGLVPS
jgi:hypothetical protein